MYICERGGMRGKEGGGEREARKKRMCAGEKGDTRKGKEKGQRRGRAGREQGNQTDSFRRLCRGNYEGPSFNLIRKIFLKIPKGFGTRLVNNEQR